MGLFYDIYNTVARFFRPQEESSGEEASKSVATNRLKLVLMQDRTNLTPRILEQMRSELIDLLSRYVELDKELLELNFEQEGDQVALMLSIPVIRAKDEEEIDAAIKAHQEMLESMNGGNTDSESTNDESDDISDSSDEENQDSEDIDSENNQIVSEETETKPKRSRKKDSESSNISTPEEMTNSSQINEEQNQEVTEGV